VNPIAIQKILLTGWPVSGSSGRGGIFSAGGANHVFKILLNFSDSIF
jgi:hypothetical protein